MKTKSLHFKFLITIIAAMLAVTVFIGGLCVYEVDNFVQTQTESLIKVTCEKDTAQINDVFGDMENSVHIMEGYVLGLLEDGDDIHDSEVQQEIISLSDEMFVDVAKHTEGAVAYYLRIAPEISDSQSGFFYSRARGEKRFVRFEPTDLSAYDRNDTEHVGWYWQAYDAGEPVWMLPYHNLNNDIVMISYVVPLYYNKEFFGVVGIDFDYMVLTDKVSNIKIYENGFAHLEFEGEEIYNLYHNKESGIHNHPEEYLSVSNKLKNGMSLVISASYSDIKQIRYDIALNIVYIAVLLGLFFALVVGIIVRRIVDPLKKLTEASAKLAGGDYNVDIIHSDTYEIKLLSTAFNNMARNLEEHERIQSLLAYRDSLTGLKNSNSYRVWVSEFDKAAEKPETAIIMIDLNCLKETNDRYGHEVGDRLIVAAAHLIADTFKRSHVFRIGGDEFLVVLRNRDLKEYGELMKKLEAECAKRFITADGEMLPVSLAMGYARYDSDEDTSFVDVFNKADDAMYENKRGAKGLN
ncbi:MAG: diguanylate cyclase [Clostridia bacterium]|nr:diguanylate cyclase [Clostridia bacterium]